ncbi:MAG TPA: hypothetical protein PLR87_07380 [Thermoanaerobaculaceae bacterium]|nr:hypothetical protein [Thermoanaerobaculaceae bacterium]
MTIVTAVAILVGLVGQVSALKSDELERPITPCTLEVLPSGDARLDQRGVFSATTTLDVVLRTSFPADYKDVTVLRLQLKTPRGHLYQVLDVPVAEPGQASPEGRVLPGYPLPVKERVLVTVVDSTGRARKVVDTPFPVGGTSIVEHGLYGMWSAEVYLSESGQLPCATARFEITP